MTGRFSAILLLAALPLALSAQTPPKKPQGAAKAAARGRYVSTASLEARVWTLPEGASPLSQAKPVSAKAVFTGRDSVAVYLAPTSSSPQQGRIPVSTIVAVDFDVDLDKAALSKAIAMGEREKAVSILRAAYSPYFPYADLPENNILDGVMELASMMFGCGRSNLRKAAGSEEKEKLARQQLGAAYDVFMVASRAKWSGLSALAELKACRTMLILDKSKSPRVERLLGAMETPRPGDEAYGFYWLLKAELALLAGDDLGQLECSVKSAAFENKDIESFPYALMLCADAYRKTGNHHRARDIYFEVAKLFPGTECAEDAIAALDGVLKSGKTKAAEESTLENAFFGLDEDMNALAGALIEVRRKKEPVFDYDDDSSGEEKHEDRK